jgi:uncharacterized protein (TIGR02118 family)
MAHQMTVLYHHPDDVAAFDAHYESTHAPLAATIPGLRSYDVLRPVPNPGEDKPVFHLLASLTFDDEVAFGAAMTSDQGRAAVADLANFASGGVTIASGPVTTVV